MSADAVATLPGPQGTPRRVYIDWLRGLAVLLMVLWHSVDAWHVAVSRDTAAFRVVGFLAGWAAPLFLFLAGVSLPMSGLSRLARGVDRQTASRLLMRRGWQVVLIAHLFRLQSFLLNPNASWAGIFRSDILNVLGLGLVMAGFAWRHATTPRRRTFWLLAPAVAVAGLMTPWSSLWWWPSLLPSRLEGYIRIVDGNAVFSLFPAVGYVFAGAYVGAALAARTGSGETRFLRSAAVAGLLLVGLSYAPWPPEAWQWARSLVVIGGRVGAMTLLLAAAAGLLAVAAPRRSGPMLVFGRTSLFVYWIHVELVYGRFSYPLHRSLSLPWALAAWVALLLALYVLARMWDQRPAGQPLVPRHMVARVG